MRMNEVIRFGRGCQIIISSAINMAWKITVDYGDIWYMETVVSMDYEEVRDYAVRKAEKLGWRN